MVDRPSIRTAAQAPTRMCTWRAQTTRPVGCYLEHCFALLLLSAIHSALPLPSFSASAVQRPTPLPTIARCVTCLAPLYCQRSRDVSLSDLMCALHRTPRAPCCECCTARRPSSHFRPLCTRLGAGTGTGTGTGTEATSSATTRTNTSTSATGSAATHTNSSTSAKESTCTCTSPAPPAPTAGVSDESSACTAQDRTSP